MNLRQGDCTAHRSAINPNKHNVHMRGFQVKRRRDVSKCNVRVVTVAVNDSTKRRSGGR